jgi:hypothetical protein
VSLFGVIMGLMFLFKEETQEHRKLYIPFAICAFFLIITNLVLK